jgi:hypothetical protein
MKSHKININISARYLSPEVIGRTGMTEVDCLAELVANSIDWNISRLDDKKPTNIIIEKGDDFIQIIDNGEGMNFEQLDKATDLGEDSNEIRDRDKDDHRKGMYGMGLKNAALTLGWKFTITTISFKDPEVEYKFEFDSKKGKENPDSDYINNLEILEDKKSIDSVLKDFNHGTCIRIENLVKEIPSVNVIKHQIEERFFYDIENLKNKNLLLFKLIDGSYSVDVEKFSIEDRFKDKVLKSDFENPNKWMKKKEYKYTGKDGNEYQLKGYLQLLKQRSFVDQQYGLHLFFKGQLIERFHKGKLFDIRGRNGELTFGILHLDGCTPDQNKSRGFIEDEIFDNVLKLIEDDFKIYKKMGVPTAKGPELINEEINKRKGIGSKHGDDDVPEDPTDVDPVPPDNPPGDEPDEDFPEGTIKISKNLNIHVNSSWVYNKALNEKNNLSWEPIYNPDTKIENLHELLVYINQESNLYKSISSTYQKTSDQNKIKDFFTRVAICESINQKLISEHGYTPEDARKITDNKVYSEVLKMKLD